MREILFRGKTVDGDWVYGSLMNHCFENFEIINGCAYSDVRDEVIPETVGQYTGIEDIHESKIFEGDVVVFRNDVYADEGVIEMVTGCWMIRNQKGNRFFLRDHPEAEIWKNIHDNFEPWMKNKEAE